MNSDVGNNSIAYPVPSVKLEDGAHKDPESQEWVVVYHGDEVAWGSKDEAERSYNEICSTAHDHARSITFTPFNGSVIDWAACPDCGTVVDDGTICPDCHTLVLSEGF